ncbi:MAG: asparagine synthase (glutamine-hydrolyzing) [Syntrophobacterales bacterium]|nr:asparagine synthase (glutamine-hydrolyzing) [Syntrophobacterales bacterium]
MCGICGKVDFTGHGVNRRLLEAMTTRLAHRGPDDEGIYIGSAGDAVCGLGHRRLSIIDLSEAGRQPMRNEDGTLWLVYNGEIYNFRELRRELEAKGHRFSSQTDGEVIIHLFEEEGTASFKRLRGMFALALWSEPSQILFLARDPLGIKPLVFFADGGRFLFASEIKALLMDPAVGREIDPEALELYLGLNYIPAPWTIFRKIRKLRPGHHLTVGKGLIKEDRYWDLPPSAADFENVKDGFTTAQAALRSALTEAVRGHLIADVPLGAFLSGGIDSSVIVALMAQNSPGPVKTYTIGYSDMAMYDERAYARDVAAMYGTDHHEIVLSGREVIDTVPAVLAALDEPFGDSSAVPTYIVARETAKDVKVALSGDGGDELFAGYRLYRGEQWQGLYRRLPRLLREGLIDDIYKFLPESREGPLTERFRRLKKFLRGAAKETLPERFLAWNELFGPTERKALLRPDFYSEAPLALTLFTTALEHRDYDSLNRMLYTDITVSLPGDMLWKVDMMSMVHPLEVRVPLLDRGVCETAFRLPGDWKLKGNRGKYIFIETFKDFLPPSLHRRPKWGFEMPIARWLKGELRWLVDTYLDRGRVEREGFFDPEAVDRLVSALDDPTRDVSWRIWNLIAFGAWHENTLG